MSRRVMFCAALAAVAAACLILFRPMSHAQGDKKGPAIIGSGTPADASLKASHKAYIDAFNKADARGVAACWAPDAEYTGPDGATIKGRENIEKTYEEFFKANPKAAISGEVTAARVLAGTTAIEDGILRLRRPGKDIEATRYSAVLVKDGEKWLLASVKEQDADPAELVKIDELEWLIGDWSGKGGTREVTTSYRWDAGRVWIVGRFEVKDKGKAVSSGTMRIGRDGAAGAIRSWTFEDTGAAGEATWTRDGERWVMESEASLPEGQVLHATNIFLPLGPDEFSFQSVDREVDGQALPDLPPVKVVRVKK